jgi:PTH1 family peptidyl-tRNA hydrolase
MPIRAIVFLGNPGPEHAETRHNLGWWVGDILADRARVRLRPEAAEFLSAEGRLGGKKVLLVKPMTYMNASGEAVNLASKLHGFEPESLIVIADDIALPLGRIRIRASGSSGGHNGLQSIIEQLGTEEFTRVRLGVGPVADGIDSAEFVLDRFDDDDFIVAREMAAHAAEAVLMILARGVEAAANVYNRKPPAPDSTGESQAGADRPGEST